MENRSILVSGGAGFLGSHFIRAWLANGGGKVRNVDALTYAGSLTRLADAAGDPRYSFTEADVADPSAIARAFSEHGPDLAVHFAAESHVTRSERDPARFTHTNVQGTRVMLEAAAEAGVSRFIHISTDEVYGPILSGEFREEDKEPGDGRATSPYAMSKAQADDLARGFDADMEVIVARPTNAFGAWQFPEKAFPRWTVRGLRGKDLLVWGDGLYVRQWLHAEDLAEALLLLLQADEIDPVYNIGPRHDSEITNIDLARWLAAHLGLPEDRVVHTSYDRPDHDRRYGVDPSRIMALGWKHGDPWQAFARTVAWYRANEDWWAPLLDEAESIYEDER